VKLQYAGRSTHLHVWRRQCLVVPPSRFRSLLHTRPGCAKGYQEVDRWLRADAAAAAAQYNGASQLSQNWTPKRIIHLNSTPENGECGRGRA
jgi:GrpB-like predicted nucleotidyltransferase (UPF0157 family)